MQKIFPSSARLQRRKSQRRAFLVESIHPVSKAFSSQQKVSLCSTEMVAFPAQQGVSILLFFSKQFTLSFQKFFNFLEFGRILNILGKKDTKYQK